MRLPTRLAFAFLLLLASFSFAQVNEQCYIDCAYSCASSCLYAADQNCAENCGRSCVQKCGGEIGITPGEECSTQTAPDGHPMQWDGVSCRDMYAADDYCSQATSCSECQNKDAYNCIWDGGGCVPCNSAQCSYSCGGGGVVPGGGGIPGGGGDDGGLINPDEFCSQFADCSKCVDSLKLFPPNSEGIPCGWSSSQGKCLYGSAQGPNSGAGGNWVFSDSSKCAKIAPEDPNKRTEPSPCAGAFIFPLVAWSAFLFSGRHVR